MSEDTQEAVCRVTVTGPGIKAEKDVSLPIAMQIMHAMFGGTSSVALAVPSQNAEHLRVGDEPANAGRLQRLSIREFLEEAGGRSFHAKVAAIGRYIRDHEGQQDFSRDDIKLRLRSAGEVMPGNFPRDFQKALQSGWIAEDPQSRGRFYVTRRGDEAIEQKFEGVSGAPVRSKRRRRPNFVDPLNERDE